MSTEESATLNVENNVEIPVPIVKPSWLHPLGHAVRALSISPDSATVAFATDEGALKLLTADKGEVIFEVESKNSFFGVSCLEFSPDGQKLAMTLENGWLYIYQVSDGSEVCRHHFPKQMPENLLWNHDSSKVFLTLGKSLLRFHLEGTPLVDVIAEEEHTMTALQWIDNKMLGYTTYSHLKIIESHTGKTRQDFSWKGSLISMEVCPNKKYVVCGTQDQTIHIWNLSNKKDLEMKGFHHKVRQMSFRDDGLAMAHATENEIIVWDFSGQGPAGKKPQVLGPFEVPALGVWYQHKGDILVSAGKDGILLFWRPQESPHPQAISGIRDQEITVCLWAPDDSYLVVGFKEGYVIRVPSPKIASLV